MSTTRKYTGVSWPCKGRIQKFYDRVCERQFYDHVKEGSERNGDKSFARKGE